ncbi:MAG: PEP/pyruvate-binding domain-containing protein [Lachnospiraceae bacterium]
MYIVNLSEVNSGSINEVGGKGANLGEMIKAGFAVPEGFCITSSAYNAFIQANQLAETIDETLKDISSNPEQSNALADKLQQIISSCRLPGQLETEIRNVYAAMSGVRVAVRSSATAEDLPEASFAGQQETFLNIHGAEELIHAVKKCFASLWTERAITYRKKSGFDKVEVALAVVVQEMIESDVSGVMFTVNPVDNNTRQVMINASYGLGESVVSGLVTPDTYIWDEEAGKITSKILGSKEIAIVYGENGTTRIDNDNRKRNEYCLTNEQIKELSVLGKKIEQHYGKAQDIEWAVKNGEIFILQARAVTTIYKTDQEKQKPGKKQSRIERMVMNNLLEHAPDPLWPLDVHPLCNVYTAKAKVSAELGIKQTGQAMSINNDGSLKILVPAIHVTPKIVPAVLKLKQFCDFEKNMAKSTEKLNDFQMKLDNIEETDLASLTIEQLITEIKAILTLADEINWIRFRYNIYPNVIINKRISFKLKMAKATFNEYDLLSDLNYKTWQMNIELGKLAALIQSYPELANQIEKLNGNARQELADILLQNPEVNTAFQTFMKSYGWKSTCTYRAFSATSWNEDISSLLELIKRASPHHQASGKYKELCSKIQSRKLMQLIEEIRGYHVNRELTLYMLERCFGLCRIRAKKIVERRNDIHSYDDILRLTISELYQLPGTPEAELKQIIDSRQQSQVNNKLIWDNMELQSISGKGREINGISGNTGTAKGRVCVIQDPSEFSKLKAGDILVCKYTDPVWTPLFTTAIAVVSDTGGPLSHSAIVAREFNIPAVLGCGNATQLLQDGQEILVDGGRGLIHIM